MECWSFSSLVLKFKFMDNWDTLVSNVYCIYDSLASSICKITYSAGQKQWTPECAIIFEEGNNTNSCIRVDIISLPGKFQRILVIRPFRTSQDLIFQAKLQRKPIKMEIHKRNNIVLPIFNGKEPLVQQSKHRNEYFTILYVYCLYQFILRTTGETNKNPAITAEMQESTC